MTEIQQRKTTISWTIRAVLAFLFLLSAVAKLYPSPYFALTTFELKQLLPMGFSETGAAYFSRLLIGCEFALGILLLQPHYFRRLVVPVSFLLLLIFCIHLSYGLATVGNEGNCGCFGSLLPMTPLAALIKNILAMGLLAYLWKTTDKSYDRNNFLVLVSVTLASMLSVFLVGPMQMKSSASAPVMPMGEPMMEEAAPAADSKDAKVEETHSAKENSSAKEEVKTQAEVVDVVKDEPKQKRSAFSNLFADVDKGKKALCFFAPGCDHCRETAKELTEMAKKNKDFPAVRIVFMDEEAELIPDFFAFAGTKYPYQVMEVGQFWKTLGLDKDTPGVFYLWNGNIIKTWDGINEKKFDGKAFQSLVGKEYSKIK